MCMDARVCDVWIFDLVCLLNMDSYVDIFHLLRSHFRQLQTKPSLYLGLRPKSTFDLLDKFGPSRERSLKQASDQSTYSYRTTWFQMGSHIAWCQAISRKGLCTLYADYFRSFVDERCSEACGMRKNWSSIEKVKDEL